MGYPHDNRAIGEDNVIAGVARVRNKKCEAYHFIKNVTGRKVCFAFLGNGGFIATTLRGIVVTWQSHSNRK